MKNTIMASFYNGEPIDEFKKSWGVFDAPLEKELDSIVRNCIDFRIGNDVGFMLTDADIIRSLCMKADCAFEYAEAFFYRTLEAIRLEKKAS